MSDEVNTQYDFTKKVNGEMLEAKTEYDLMRHKDVRNFHPGWAIYFVDGTWLCHAHGHFKSEDAFYADRYVSEKDAQSSLDSIRDDKEYYGEEFDTEAKIVLAWEPLCESLRVEIKGLKDANSISPDKIMDITFALQGILSDLNPKNS